MSTPRRGACWGVTAPGRQALGQLRGSGLGGVGTGGRDLSHSLGSRLPLILLPSRCKAVFFFFNYFKLLEMIYELLYQAPNSFITCFLKESSKEQSVSVELEPTANTAPRDL